MDLRLRQVGIVLLVIGLLDIGAMVVCIALGISYSSSLNIFAVIAGIFLIRGNKTAANIVRHYAAVTLSAVLMIAALLLFIQPLSLTFAFVRTEPGTSILSLLVVAAFVALNFWVVVHLGRLGYGRLIKWSLGFGAGVVLVTGIPLRCGNSGI